jgi:hypothetical protein
LWLSGAGALLESRLCRVDVAITQERVPEKCNCAGVKCVG